MESCVQVKLNQLGYKTNTNAEAYIYVCEKWYRNELIDGFHKRTSIQGEVYEIDRLNFAKRGCTDDANLCEIVSINVGEEKQNEEINQMIDSNRFDVMYRKQLEMMSATGTVAAYIRLENATYLENGKVVGGEVKINYCFASNYIPLTVVNDEVIEAAFTGSDVDKGKKSTTLVVFTKRNGLYKAETYLFDDTGKEIGLYWLQLGDVKPFQVMRVAEVNNLDGMEGYGIPKLWNAIPSLKKIDLCNMILNGDLEKGEKLILTNEAIVPLGANGKPKEHTSMMKKLFVFLGEKLPAQDSLIKEYNPEIRIDEITKALELSLSLFSMMFGFGSKKYSFENGQIKTATEYIGERQDSMQELNKQRAAAADYISGIIKAMMWFSNTFNETTYDLDAEVCISFDDSYIEDKNTKIESMRADAQTFSEIQEFTIRYIMERLNLDREHAIEVFENRYVEEDPEELD